MNDVLGFLKKREQQKRTSKDFLLDFFDVVSFLVLVAGLVLIVRVFVFNPFTVVGESMEPTFHERDFVIVDKISPRFHEYKRGDIIVFVPPNRDINYIKRIVGLPGEVVKIQDEGVSICDSNGQDCQELEEDYLPDGTQTKAECGVDEFVVTSGAYFVMGDNRDHSTDSRCCFGVSCYDGTNYLLPKDYILGEVALKLYPEITKY